MPTRIFTISRYKRSFGIPPPLPYRSGKDRRYMFAGPSLKYERCNKVYNEVEYIGRKYLYNKVLLEMHYNELISKRSFGEEDLLMTKDRQTDTDDIEPD